MRGKLGSSEAVDVVWSQELLKAKTLKLDIWKPQPRNSRSKRAEILEACDFFEKWLDF